MRSPRWRRSRRRKRRRPSLTRQKHNLPTSIPSIVGAIGYSTKMQDMQQRMDQIFREATRDVNQHTGFLEGPDFTSSVKLSEDHSNYVVHVALPDRDMKNVDVKLESNNVLRITAKEEKKEQATSAAKGADKQAQPAAYEIGRYEQMLTLPGPVDASKMQIDRSGNSVTITIPKSQFVSRRTLDERQAATRA